MHGIVYDATKVKVCQAFYEICDYADFPMNGQMCSGGISCPGSRFTKNSYTILSIIHSWIK